MTEHHAHGAPSGRELTSLAVSATLHCLTGCAIGEVLGMVIGTALGWGDWSTIALAVVLAFFFGTCSPSGRCSARGCRSARP